MPTNPYSNYLEATILSADPIELVRILYRTAIDSVPMPQVEQTPQDNMAAASLDAAVARATQWLLSRQHEDGLWVFELEADATIPAEYILQLAENLGKGVASSFSTLA